MIFITCYYMTITCHYTAGVSLMVTVVLVLVTVAHWPDTITGTVTLTHGTTASGMTTSGWHDPSHDITSSS